MGHVCIILIPAGLGPTLVSCLRYFLAFPSRNLPGFSRASCTPRGAGSLLSANTTRAKTAATNPATTSAYQVGKRAGGRFWPSLPPSSLSEADPPPPLLCLSSSALTAFCCGCGTESTLSCNERNEMASSWQQTKEEAESYAHDPGLLPVGREHGFFPDGPDRVFRSDTNFL